MVEKLRARYKEYQQAATAAHKKSTVIDNFFHTGNAANKNPCHTQFYEDMCRMMGELVHSEQAAEQAPEVALFLLEEPQLYKDRDCYWFMYVCIGFIRELVPLMDKEHCAALATRMEQLYKKRDRMPVQEQTYKMLKKAGK